MPEQINIEIKAKTDRIGEIREILKSIADKVYVEHQTDIYFNTSEGRLKLRKKQRKTELIYYTREKKKGPKKSEIIFLDVGEELEDILTRSLGVVAIVEKRRELYFTDNTQFHIDNVKGVGDFVEIEVMGENLEETVKKCEEYMEMLGIKRGELVAESYCDLVQKLYKEYT